jgi:hypothetical protein
VIDLDDARKTTDLPSPGATNWNGRARAEFPLREKWKKGWQMLSDPVGKEVTRAQDYRSKAAECAEIAQQTGASKVDDDLLRLEQSYITLAENEEWLDRNSDKLVSE